MKLNQPFRRPTLNPEERVAFNTPEPVKAEVSEPVIPALEPVEEMAKPVVPPLVKSDSTPAFPKLEKVQKKQVELSPPQPVAEVKATAEPAPIAGGEPKPVREEKPAVAWPFTKEEQKEIEQELQEELAKPALVPSVPAIPKLEVTKGNGEVKKVDVPKLDAYNKMEVVHLLIGRSSEDEEIVLLQSFPERFVRSKNQEDFNRQILERVQAHYGKMHGDRMYDFYERHTQHKLEIQPLTPQLANKGVEWVCALQDSGKPSSVDIHNYAAAEGISVDDAGLEIKLQKLFYQDPSFIYTWALVKVKIGHDFGAYKLSELMPNL